MKKNAYVIVVVVIVFLIKSIVDNWMFDLFITFFGIAVLAFVLYKKNKNELKMNNLLLVLLFLILTITLPFLFNLLK